MKTIEDFITPAILLYGSEYYGSDSVKEVFNVAENLFNEYRRRLEPMEFRMYHRKGLEEGTLFIRYLDKIEFGEGEYPVTAHFSHFGKVWTGSFSKDGKEKDTGEQLYVLTRGYILD